MELKKSPGNIFFFVKSGACCMELLGTILLLRLSLKGGGSESLQVNLDKC